MNSIQQVYFCGLGALGGMYASRLCAVPGVDLKIVADLERIQRYQEHGIVVNGNRLRLSFLSPTDTAPIADLVIIGVKWHQLDQALAQIRPFVGPSTVILSLLNGIESENVIARTLGVQPLYSFVVETDAGRKGQQIEYRTLGTIVFGEASNVNISPRVAAVRDLFDQAAIPYRIPADMLRDLWWKFMLNVGVNPTSAIMKAPYGVFQKNAEARQCVRMACREVLDIARQAGISLAEQDIDAIFPIIDRAPSHVSKSASVGRCTCRVARSPAMILPISAISPGVARYSLRSPGSTSKSATSSHRSAANRTAGT